MEGHFLSPRSQMWRRYCARMLDNCIVTTFLIIMACCADVDILTTQEYSTQMLFLALGSVVIMSYEALSLNMYGTTLGKKMLGIHIKDLNNHKIGFYKAFKRVIAIQVKIFALLLPFIMFITMLVEYFYFMKHGKSSLDTSYELEFSYGNVNYFNYTLAFIITIPITFVIVLPTLLLLGFMLIMLFPNLLGMSITMPL